MGPGGDAEEQHEPPDTLEAAVVEAAVVKQPTEDGSYAALFSLWDQLKSWDAFKGSREFFAIADSVEPLEIGSEAPMLDHINQVLHWRDAAKLCQWEEAEKSKGVDRETTYQIAKLHLATHGSIVREGAFTKTRRLAIVLDQKRISDTLHEPCERGVRIHTCLDACRTAPTAVFLWRKLWYSFANIRP